MKELVELIDKLYVKDGLKNQHRKQLLNKIEQMIPKKEVKEVVK